MIPILYNSDERRFVNNGRGRLSDATRCIVTEERNGIYELEIDYPITGVHFDEIVNGRLIVATHDDKHDLQPFEVYKRTVPNLNGIVTFYAHHISYKLNGVTVAPFTARSAATALQGISDNSINDNPFRFWTDKTTVADYESKLPRNARAMLAGEENSILDVFGTGEYEFDKFEVKLHAARGKDSDCEIRYGKNLTDLNQDVDKSGTFNAIVPFWADSEGNIVMLPERLIVYEGLEPQTTFLTDHNLIVIRTETDEPIEVTYWQVDASPMNMSDAFEEAPTAEELRVAAKARFESGKYWAPTENLTIDFVQLWQTEEYKEYAGLQRVSLCDTVSVYYPQAGIAAVKQKVVRVTYNVLLDRYDSIELGSLRTTLGEQIRQGIMEEVPTTSMMDAAIQYATDLIRGGLGGYVVMTPGPNGYPQEILIMDTPDVNTAVNVWRFNQGGLGHSSNGYDGPFSDIALTQDGKINASMITVGILTANLIKAGVLSDANNNVSFNLDTGTLNITKGSIDLGNGLFSVGDNGYLIASSGKIASFDIRSDGLVREERSSGSLKKIDSIGSWGYTRAVTGLDGSYNYRSAGYYTADGVMVYGKTGVTSLPDNWESPSSIGDNWFSFQSFLDDNGNPFLQIRTGGALIGLWHGSQEAYPIEFYQKADFSKNVLVRGSLTVYGTKPRAVLTKNYDRRLLYCYETPTPLFGDIGEAALDDEGLCYVDLDDIFTETIADKVEYQVFLQKEGEGDCWVADKNPRYFVIQGTPGLKVAWELKAKQRDYEAYRFDLSETWLDEYAPINDSDLFEQYIKEQEALLYD